MFFGQDVPTKTDIIAFHKSFGNSVGVLGNQSCLSVEQLNNRQHPNVHAVFSCLFENEVMID
jgi:hypothetical protein